jgi:hypothetical protein
MKRLLLALLFVCAAYGQDRFIISGAPTLGASDYTITIVSPQGKRLEIESFVVQAVGGEVTAATERDCSSVTTSTPLTPVAANSESATAIGTRMAVYANSAASSCSSFASFSTEKGWKVPNNTLLNIPALGLYKESADAGKNINLRLSGNGFTALYQIIVRVAR